MELSKSKKDMQKKKRDFMKKAVLAAFITLILGVVGMVIGYEFLGGFAEFGCIIAVSVMGAFIILFNEKRNK